MNISQPGSAMDSVGGMDTMQMFSSLVNRDAEVLVLKDCRTNEFPNVLESEQIKVMTPQVVLLKHPNLDCQSCSFFIFFPY